MSYTASYIVNSSSAQGATDFQFTFPYIKEEHIEVFLNFSKITQGSGSAQYQVITNVSPKLIRLNTGIASANLRVEVRRNSSLGSPLVDYADGSTLTANDLDTSALQSLYIDQELKDNQSKTVSVDEATGLPSMGESSAGNLRLTKVADPTAAQDAATKNYVDTKVFTSSQIQDGTLVNADINASAAIAGTKISPNFGSQNIVTSGTVDGRDVSADGSKLDGIETGATADQTNAEIRAAVEAASDSNVFTDADHTKLNAIEAGATADQTNAEIRAAVEAATDSNVFTDADHTKLNAIQANATADQTASEIKTLLQSDKLTDSEIATGTLDNRYFTETELTGGALDGRYYTETESDARYFNISTGDTIKDGDTFPDNDTTIATTAAINDRIVDLVDDVGGFVPIANETSFPNANPDVNNGAGTLVSIKALGSDLTSNGSGVATISNGTVGNSTVTITGLANSTTYAATFGMIVETTSTLNTYTFHRLVPKATEVSTVSGSISNVNTVAGAISNVNSVASNATNINTVAGINANVTTVAGISSNVTSVAGNSTNINAVNSNATNINTVAGAITNVNTVGGSIANVNTVATNISSVNDFADRYRVASSDPSSNNDTGDLVFNTTSNELRVYNGSAWQGGVTATGNLLSKSGDQMTGNLTFSGSQTVDGRDVSVDGAKLDGIAASANNYTHPNHTGEVTSSADGAQTITDNVVDEANLKVSNSPSNGQFLSAQSGNTGGLTWATPANTTYTVGDGGLTQKNFTTTLKTKLDGIASSANNYAISTDLLDEDDMASDSATKVPSQQSVKAFSSSATNLTSGTIPAARVPTLNQNTTGSAGSFTAGSASNLNSGTLPDARFPATLPAASGANLTSLPAANLTGTLPSISGANLTNLPAAGGGSITATASGSIANGAAVYKKSDGTVSTIATATKMLSKLEKSEITHFLDPVEMNAGTEQASLSGVGVAYDTTTKCVIAVWGGTDASAPAANTYYKDVWSNVGVVSGSGKDCKIKWGSPQVIADFSSNNLHNYGPTVCSIGGGKVVIGWKDRTNNNLLAVVATISAANKNVSLGSVVTENNETWGAEQKVLSLGTDKFIMGAGTGGQWNRTDPKFFVGTVSGTTITLQTRSSSAGISSGSVRDWTVNADYDKIFISAEEQSGSNYWTTFCAGSISGNSISFGSFTRFTGTGAGGTNRYYGLPIIWDDTNNRLVCWMRMDDWTAQDGIYTSNRYRTLTATVSGTTLTVDGAWQDYTQRVHSDSSPQYATDYYTTSQSAIYDPNLGGVVNVMKLQSEKLQTPDHDVDDVDPYEIAVKNTGFVRALTGSGSTYTATDDHSIGAAFTQLWQRDLYQNTNPNVQGVQTQGMSICYDTDNKQVIIIQYGIWNQNEKEDRASEAWAMAIKTFKPTTTASDFIGFAEAAYTNGQTATITTAGGTNESQSSLTVGSSYYLQGNGTLSTTPDTTYGSIFAGIATAATKLVVSQNNKVNLTGVITSDGDGITDFADKSITSRKLKTGNYPYKRGLILTTGGFSENQGDEASDKNDSTARKRIHEPSSLVWATPDWELVSYGDDLVISGGSKAIYTRMMHLDHDYGGTTDKEVGEVWPSHRFYKVVYESITGDGSNAGDLRLQLASQGTTLTHSSVS